MSDPIKLTFEQRQRVTGVLDEIDNDPEVVACELIYLRDLADASRGVHPAGTETTSEGASAGAEPRAIPADAEDPFGSRKLSDILASHTVRMPTMDEAEDLVRLIVESFRDASSPSVEIAVEEILMTVEPWYIVAVNSNEQFRERSERPQSGPAFDAAHDMPFSPPSGVPTPAPTEPLDPLHKYSLTLHWSVSEQEWCARSPEWPSLSFFHRDAGEAAKGLRDVIVDALRACRDDKEKPPVAVLLEYASGSPTPAPTEEPVRVADPYEYRTTQGARKYWDGEPDLSAQGWEEWREWERFDYHEERYWRRARGTAGEVPAASATQADGSPTPAQQEDR